MVWRDVTIGVLAIVLRRIAEKIMILVIKEALVANADFETDFTDRFLGVLNEPPSIDQPFLGQGFGKSFTDFFGE